MTLKILMVVVAFYLLGNVADTFLTPVLTKVSKALRMSETIAGVTLLAFANGAPDIIASVTAGDQEGGVFISVGGLFGACMFGATMVLGLCILKSKTPVEVSFKTSLKKMIPAQWTRDLLFYVLAGVVIIIYGMIGKINIWMAGGFLSLYIL